MSMPLAAPLAWNLVAGAYAKDTRPAFEPYARRALDLAAGAAPLDVLDVATGPGTLAVLAAKDGHRVTALDFSAEMLGQFRARLEGEPLPITLLEADGMALPFADETFDAAFSMFGLIFFPDRGRGFRELHRVLRPGRRAAVSSWVPMSEIPMMVSIFSAMAALLQQPPSPPSEPVLASEEACVREMTAAGFVDVSVERRAEAIVSSSLAEFWSWFPAACAPMALVRQRMGDAFDLIEVGIHERLRAEYGDGPVTMTMTALLSCGRRP
jgi:SAM-dependent methyltransferase